MPRSISRPLVGSGTAEPLNVVQLLAVAISLLDANVTFAGVAVSPTAVEEDAEDET